MKPIQIMIVEDQSMPRQLFEMIVNGTEEYRTAVSIDNAEMADIYCARYPIDLILMDVVTKNGASGLDATARIKRQYPHIKVIIVTSMPECSFIRRAREAGADSFWYKEISREPILSLMGRTMAGESVYPDTAPSTRLGDAWSTELTSTELAVLRELTGGYTDEEIGERLHISRFTVRDYLKTIREKTGFRSRTELAVRASQCGIVLLDRPEE